jgi:hypothetical protein
MGTRGLTVSHSLEWRYAAIVTDEQAAARVELGDAAGALWADRADDLRVEAHVRVDGGVIDFALSATVSAAGRARRRDLVADLQVPSHRVRHVEALERAGHVRTRWRCPSRFT